MRAAIQTHFRSRRLNRLYPLFERVHSERGAVDLVDIGGTQRYWQLASQSALEQFNVTITVVNLPIENLPEDNGRFRFVSADACDLSSFDDRTFDIAHSNSVVEHVGDWERMTRYASELRRVADAFYVQTPNYWFPIEPHAITPFFHWLPKPLRVRLVERFALGNWKRAETIDMAMREVESARLLTRRAFQALFPDGELHTERVLGCAKSFVAVRNSASPLG